MEDREAELGRPLSAAEQEAILTRHGHPVVVAGHYRTDHRSVAFGRQLIGPELFPLYIKVLSINVALTVALCLVAAAVVAGGHSLPQSIPAIFSHVFLQFGIVTLVFSLAQRNIARFPERWNPRSPLPASAADRQRVPRASSIAEIVVLAIFVFWWLAAPQILGSLLGPAATVVQPGPGWRMLYTPILLLALAGLVAPVVNLFRPEWTWFRSLARLVTTGIFLVVLLFSYQAGNWLTVAATAGAQDHYRQVVALVNHWFGVSLIVTAIGCVLQMLLEIWRLTRHRPNGMVASVS
jgi:hypothetical protein